MLSHIGPWVIECDAASTREMYGKMEHGAARECKCPGCANYEAVREAHLPETFRDLLARFGADPDKEVSVRRVAPLTDGLSLYAGSFALIGVILAGPHDNRTGCAKVDVFEPIGPGAYVSLRNWNAPLAPWPEKGALRLRFLLIMPWEGKDSAAPVNLAKCKGPVRSRRR
jgi:hypothetical protein